MSRNESLRQALEFLNYRRIDLIWRRALFKGVNRRGAKFKPQPMIEHKSCKRSDWFNPTRKLL